MNETYVDWLFVQLGSTWTFDAVFMFVFPPLGLLSCAGNLVSYWIFSNRRFGHKPLYKYLKVSCVNSALVNFVFSMSFVCDSRRFLGVSSSYLAAWFRCFVKIPLLNMAYFYGCFLDIILAIERLCELTSLKKQFNRLSPSAVCVAVFLAVFLLDLPFFFVFEPKLVANITRSQLVYHYGESPFAVSQLGIVIKNINYVIRDLVTLCVLIVINITSLVVLNKTYPVDVHQLSVVGKNKNTAKQGRLLVSVCHRANRMIFKMIFLICLLSTLEHVFLVASLALFDVNYFKRAKFYCIFFSNVSMFSKHSINFFIFYSYNSMFKRIFYQLVGSCKRST